MHTTAVPASPALDTAAESRDLGGLLGLVGRREVPFPLTLVRVRATLIGRFARTVVEQTFHNPHRQALEAVHIFPLPPDGAVVAFELHCGDLVVRGECRERQAAERAFADARDAGQRAGLLTAERRDVHTLRVTNIPAGQNVRVRLVVIERLPEADGASEWRFPTVVAPRYIPGRPTGHQGDGVEADTARVPDASRISPPLRLTGGTTLDLAVAIVGPIASVAASQHAVKASLGDTVHVAPATRATLDRDFVLRIEPAEPDAHAQPVAAFTDGAHTAVLVHPPDIEGGRRMARDAVFVLDRSGSMGGAKMDAGRRAMKAALRGLDAGDRFKLIVFDTSYEAFASDFLAVDDVTVGAADEWIDRVDARGGTDVLRPLLDALAGDTPAGRLRTVLIITDGEVGNEDELAKAVARHRGRSLVFTAGIDTAVNEGLLARLARLGGGTCELMTPSDDIEGRIAALEARLAQPAAWDVRVAGGEAARPESLTLFAGRGSWVLLTGAPEQVAIFGQTAAGAWQADAAPARVDMPLGALWARERVAWLEDRAVAEPAAEAGLRDEIVAVATAHGVATRYTAFVAVEEQVSVTGERVTVVQPVELPAQWQRPMAPVFAPPMPMAAAPMAAPPMAAPQPPAARSWFGDWAGDVDAEMMADAMPEPGPDLSRQRTRPLGAGVKHAKLDVAAPIVDARPEPGGADPRRRVESALALAQGVDGSVDGDVTRTAALVLALLALGHSRRRGSRRRAVQKAAVWLDAHRTGASSGLVADTLDALARVESGGAPPDLAALDTLRAPLARVLGDAGWEALAAALSPVR